jgi:hypothetical protein
MKIKRIGEVAIIAHLKEGPLEPCVVCISIDGIEDGETVTLCKHGRSPEKTTYTVCDGAITAKVEEAKYTLTVDTAKVRFNVVEDGGRLFLKRPKEDPQQLCEKLFRLCIAMADRLNEQDAKIANLEGYDTE